MQNEDLNTKNIVDTGVTEAAESEAAAPKSDNEQQQSATSDGPNTMPDESHANPDIKAKSSFFYRGLQNFWQGIVSRQVIHKIITLLFALAVFSFTYMHMSAHRSVLTYMGVMLLMVLVYAEILIIKDHLWVIEGSMRESRRWRDIFFNQTTLRRQRIRKFLIVLFAMAIFSFIIIKLEGKAHPLFTFMGMILMITVLYYEILTIRDEVSIMLQSLTKETKDNDTCRSIHEKFLQTSPETEASAPLQVPSVEKDNNDNKTC